MNYDQLVFDLKHTPSVKLLQRDHAPLIISFLHRAFKQAQVVSVPFAELGERLETYLETLNEVRPGAYPLPAPTYLKQWASDEFQLVRIISRGDEVNVELTAHAERAIGWIEELYKREFIGTESHFRSIMQLLEEIVERSTEDAETRVQQLEAQRDALQREIDTIRSTGTVVPSTTTQIKERFQLASGFARQMTRDFAEVEQNFRTIARDLQERQLQPGARKGELVGHVLDADADLRDSDQGRSFYAFWEFLMSPSQQDILTRRLDYVYRLPALEGVVRDHPLLRRITRALIDAGDKIVQSNHRLSEQVRRLLDDRTLAESRRARALIADIKQHALRLAQQPPLDDTLCEIEGAPEVQLVMEKPLWEPRTEVVIATHSLAVGTINLADESLQSLYQQFYIDEALLIRRIETMLQTNARCTLGDILERYPAEQGLAEIIGYLVIASNNPRHTIDNAVEEQVELWGSDDETPPRVVSIPRVIFQHAYAA